MLYRHSGITSPKTKQILKKANNHLRAFERRKKLWVEGNIEGLLYEAMTIQKRFFFSIQVFLSRTFTNHRTAGKGGGHFLNSSLPLPPASQTLRHQPGDCCRELTSAHSQQPDSSRKPLVSESKSLTTKLRALKLKIEN